MPIYQVELDRRGRDDSGLRVVTKRGRTWECTSFPRSLLAQVRDRYGSGRSGVYLLWGTGNETSIPSLYIGESDEAFTRLNNHLRTDTKDYWQNTVVFTTTDKGMHKAHVQHIEAELVKLARQCNRAEVMNATSPRPASLHGSDLDEVEEFTADLLDCLDVLGVSFFRPVQHAKLESDAEITSKRESNELETTMTVFGHSGTANPEKSTSNDDDLTINSKGIVAHGYERGDRFVVKARSQAVKNETPSARNNPRFKHIPNLRQRLVRKGVLRDSGYAYEFTKDYFFDSPSAASCTVLGASSNGKEAWKNKDGQSLGQIRSSNIPTIHAEDETVHDHSSTERQHDLFLNHKSIEARGYVSKDGFVVMRGSQAVGDQDVTNSIPASSERKRQELIDDATLKREGNIYVLTEDCDLNSASKAAGVLLGASYNGKKYWVDSQGLPLGEILES